MKITVGSAGTAFCSVNDASVVAPFFPRDAGALLYVHTYKHTYIHVSTTFLHGNERGFSLTLLFRSFLAVFAFDAVCCLSLLSLSVADDDDDDDVPGVLPFRELLCVEEEEEFIVDLEK